MNEIAAPKANNLKAAASIIKDNNAKGIRTYISINNHYEGCEPFTIQRLVKLM